MSRRVKGAKPEDRILIALLFGKNTPSGIQRFWQKRDVWTSVSRYSQKCRKMASEKLLKKTVVSSPRKAEYYGLNLSTIGKGLITEWERTNKGTLSLEGRRAVYLFLTSKYLKSTIGEIIDKKKPFSPFRFLLWWNILWRIEKTTDPSAAPFARIIAELQYVEKDEQEEYIGFVKQTIESNNQKQSLRELEIALEETEKRLAQEEDQLTRIRKKKWKKQKKTSGK